MDTFVIVVLKDVLPDYVFNLFFLLFCSITMPTTNVYKNNWHVTNEMLKVFLVQFSNVYGEKFLTSNVHNILHVYYEVFFSDR